MGFFKSNNMIINSFLKKNNTIVKNSLVNTGKNPVTELFYGGSDGQFSRYIFQIDLERLRELVREGHLDPNDLTHTLSFTNTSFFDYRLNDKSFRGMNRAQSISLELHLIQEDFSEGIGYDMIRSGFSVGDSVYSENGSNYYHSHDGNTWKMMNNLSGNITYETKTYGTGIFCNGVELLEEVDVAYIDPDTNELTGSCIGEIDLYDGSENVVFDVTDIVNNLLNGTLYENSTFILKFKDVYEGMITDKKNYVGFFTRNAESIYSPFLQTSTNTTFNDNRSNFVLSEDNKLYLYNYVNGKLADLPSIPTVTIVDDPQDYIDFGLQTSALVEYNACGINKVYKAGKGIYYINVNIYEGMFFLGQNVDPNNNTTLNRYEHSKCGLLYDLWSVELPNGDRKVIEQSFSPIDPYVTEYNPSNQTSYSLNYRGINNGSRLNRGEIRDFYVVPKVKYSYGKLNGNLDIYMTLYCKEGNAEITIFDNVRMDKLSDGSSRFKLDTMSLYPNRYFIDVYLSDGSEIKCDKEAVMFEIVSEKNFRLNSRTTRPNIG